MAKPIYKRILLKLSGEALAAGAESRDIINFDYLEEICSVIKRLHAEGVQIALLVGAGNIWRGGRNSSNLNRARADDMGMLATVINCIAIENQLNGMGVPATVLSAVEMNKVADLFTARTADSYLNEGRVIVLGGGTGNPYFTTDTGALLRAIEINADIALLAKNIDGLYSADPRKDPTAVKYDEITYAEVIEKNLRAIDASASCLAMDNKMPILIFGLDKPENIIDAVYGKKIGTVIK